MRARGMVVASLLVGCGGAAVATTSPAIKTNPTDEDACAHADKLASDYVAIHFGQRPRSSDSCVRMLRRIALWSPSARDCYARCDVEAGAFEDIASCARACPVPPYDLPDEGPLPGEPNDPDHVIVRNRWRFKACYNRALKETKEAGGTIRVKVAVSPAGAVSYAIVESDAKPAWLADCVAHAFVFMKFPLPTGGENANFTVPVVLSAHAPASSSVSPP